MEASALHTAHAPAAALAGRSPLLRLQGDERLIALIRRGNHGAFEALFSRYQSRLLAFCRHMLGSSEDAEDVLQEVFTAAFNAICADERPINARPWLYRIARNRCLNHLRRPSHAGQDSMDVFERDGGLTTADTVHRREEFRQVVADVQELPETQRTALLLREMDALSYDQIAEAMDTTVPSIKSLLVRARVSLGEAAEARLLTCEEVRFELGEVAEGLAKSSAPARRHLKSCDRCRSFKSQLRKSTKALAAIYPIGPLIIVQKLLASKLGIGTLGGGSAAGAGAAGTAGGAGAGAGAAGSSAGAAGAAGAAAGGSSVGGLAGASAGAGGFLSVGGGVLSGKAASAVVAAAIVTAGAVEVERVRESSQPAATPAAEPTAAQAPDRPVPGPLGNGPDEGAAGVVPPGTDPSAGALDGQDEQEAAAVEGEDAEEKATEAEAKSENTASPAAPTTPATAGTVTTAPAHPAGAHPSAPREEHGSATAKLPPHPPQPEVEVSSPDAVQDAPNSDEEVDAPRVEPVDDDTADSLP